MAMLLDAPATGCRHRIPRTGRPPADLLDPAWEALPALAVDRFHPRSGGHRPAVEARLGHDGRQLFLRFRVQDAWVRSRTVAANGGVCTDSCVELFIEPLPGLGYFNFEANAGGTLHASHITDPAPASSPTGFAGCSLLADHELALVAVRSSLPPVVDPELPGSLEWRLSLAIPFALLATRLGRMPPVPGCWRGNLYKCADHTSHPHWASWSPLGERLAFHQPERFGDLELA